MVHWTSIQGVSPPDAQQPSMQSSAVSYEVSAILFGFLHLRRLDTLAVGDGRGLDLAAILKSGLSNRKLIAAAQTRSGLARELCLIVLSLPGDDYGV